MAADNKGSSVDHFGSLETETRIEGVVIGRLVRGANRAEALVDYPGNPTGGPLTALSTIESTEDDVGRDIALAFERGDPRRPLILGFLVEAGTAIEPVEGERGEPAASATLRDGVSASEAEVDGERLVLSADREIVLKCGKASITLTRAGKVLIRGKYLLSRSSGVNRIKGGSVQIN